MSTEATRSTKMKMTNKSGEIPVSLIETEILPRLPAKSVGRCMCVCKQWKSFLSTTAFARMHLRHVTINDYKLLLIDNHLPRPSCRTVDCKPLKKGSIITIESKPIPDLSGQYILASFDGLVCLTSREVPAQLTFWNPLTGAYKKLSNSGNPFTSFNRDAPIGFYKDSFNDYKLVLLFGRDSVAYIYSHRLDSWRKVEFSVGFNIIYSLRSQATFCGKCLYFSGFKLSGSHRWIICFDVNTEKFRKIQCPLIPGDAIDESISLVVLNGCIHLCVNYEINIDAIDYIQGDFWRLDGDGDGGGERWVKLVGFPRTKHDEERYRRRRGPDICVTSNGNWLAVSEGSYSYKKMTTEDFIKKYWDFSSWYWVYGVREIYVETLVSPNL